MTDPVSKPKRIKFSSPFFYIPLCLCVAGFVAYLLFIHQFLAITERVEADILVVEGWIPGDLLPPAAKEFNQGKYTLLMVSGIMHAPENNQSEPESLAQVSAAKLEKLGIPHGSLVVCPAPFTRWMRTNKSAHAVHEKIAELGLKPKGINVLTAGPHARETWAAYRHAFGADAPIGIISIPKNEYPADRWWLTKHGWLWVTKDFIAWIKEIVFGQRA